MIESRSPDRFNRAAYSSPVAIKRYERQSGLTEVERTILQSVRPEIRDKRLLDVGVGGGRTTASLLEISRDYTAIDYSPGMAATVKRRYGLDSVYCCDVRKMGRFAANTFDFVLFSFNGLDYIGHEDRLIALSEIYRVLRPGAIFVFSSHNRSGDAAKLPWQQRDRRLSKVFIKRCIKILLAMPRHWRMRRFELRQAEYAILNDTAFGFAILTYYIDVDSQKRQLEALGFEGIVAYSTSGVMVNEDSSSPWVHYLARKPDLRGDRGKEKGE